MKDRPRSDSVSAWVSTVLVALAACSVAVLAMARQPHFVSPSHEAIVSMIAGQTATLLPSGKILLLGGETPEGPIAAATIRDPATGTNASVPNTLYFARAWHTATLLPSGRVLVLGGVGKSSQVVPSAELFDPATQTFSVLPPTGLTARAYHTATLLTDGQVLIAGGITASGKVSGKMELWDARTSTVSLSNVEMLVPRKGQTATLEPNGSVLFWGGSDKYGNALNYGEVFDPATETERIEGNEPRNSTLSPLVEASVPRDGDQNVPLNTLIGVRFSTPLDVQSLNANTVTLGDSNNNQFPASIVPAEAGMLVFVTPQKALLPGTKYSLLIAGAEDPAGQSLPNTAVNFTTIGQAASGLVGILGSGSSANSDDPFSSPWRKLPSLHAAPRVTAVAGQALQLNGEPLKGVSLQIGNKQARTDNTGRFLLEGIPSGHQVMWIIGTSANFGNVSYGIYEVGVGVTAGITNVLNYTIWMTPLDTLHEVSIASPTQAETVITNPSLPGLELHIPPQTTTVDWYGKVVTKIGITPIPVKQPPFPLPNVQVPIYFTIQPGGAYLYGPGGSKAGAQLYYPNSNNAPPNTVFDFWNYDAPQRGWYIYGTGKVSQDGKQVIPNPGVEIYQFTGAMVGSPSAEKNVGPTAYPPPHDGEPVDLSTGLFIYNKTDLVLPDVIPIQLTRTYTADDGTSRSFGIGAMQFYDILIAGNTNPYTYVELMLPDGARIYFYRTSPGTNYNAVYAHTSTQSSWYGATLAYNTTAYSGASWMLTTRDGTKYFFPDAFSQSSPLKMALIGIQDRYGNTLRISRDSNGNILSIVSPNDRYILFQHDSQNRVTQAQDSTGRTVTYTYDSGGRLSTVTDANGGVTTYTYDSNNNMLTLKDARGITYLTNEYDSNGRVIKQTLADNSTYQFAWTLPQQPPAAMSYQTSGGSPGGSSTQILAFRGCTTCSENYLPFVVQADVTDPRGLVREVKFNATAQMTSDTYALGTPLQAVYTYTYFADNLLQSVTDPLGRTTSYVDDSNGNLTAVTQLSGTSNAVTTSFSYDPTFSQLTGVTDGLSHTTSFTVDSNGNTTAISDALTHKTTMSYDSEGRVLTVTDPLNNKTQFAYDPSDNLISITDPLGRATGQSFDGAGRLVNRTDPLGETTKYAYDKLNEITGVIDPLNGQTLFAYDASGNLTGVTDANGNTTGYTYDNMDRLATRTDPLSRAESYQYDGAGNLTQFTDRRGEITSYTYDNLNRRTFAGFNTQAGPTYDSTISYTYDAGNRLTQAVDSGTGTITRAYDGLDRLTSETTPQGSVTYTYDAANRRTSMTVAGQTAVGYSYDNANRLTQIAQGSSTVSFVYDNANRRTSLTLPNGVAMSYSYDNGSELTGISYTLGQNSLGSLTYAYDLAGRRSSVGGSLAAVNLPNAISTTAYDAANELTQWGTATPTYDANGNTLSDGTNTYVWNARNQLASMNLTGEAFQYDPFGRRVGKTILSTTTNYLYDGTNPVQELSGTTPTANMLTGGVDEYFTRTDSMGTANFLTDALGSTISLTNGAGGTLASYTYEPFGNSTTSGSSTNSYQYTGRENDGTGPFFYRNRYYSPTLQRFISEDPIGFLGGLNHYAYVGDAPTIHVDPLGLCWIYQQSTGNLYYNPDVSYDSGPVSSPEDLILEYSVSSSASTYIGQGYSGAGAGWNDPSLADVPDIGPVPQGFWNIGNMQPRGPGRTGNNVLPLTPAPGTNMFTRNPNSFFIHGDLRHGPANRASTGCIVMPPGIRQKIANSSDKCLAVVP